MHLVVCIKQILDPEIPPSDFKLDHEARRPAQGIASQVISIFDENALEIALQLRDSCGGGTITAISIGSESAIDALRKALSMRADEALLVREADFTALDTYNTAKILAAAIRKLQPADLILCGRESGDWHGGQVAAFLAAELDRPYAALVAGVKRESDEWQFRRQSDEGWEVVACTGPAVISVTNDEHNLPRIPKVRDNMLAFRKSIPVWGAAELEVTPDSIAEPKNALELDKLFIPQVTRHCEFIAGDNVQHKAELLVEKLARMHVL